MFCDPLDFQQFTTVIKSLNPTGPTIIVSAPSNGGKISSTFAQRPLARLLHAAVAQTGRSTVITLLAQLLNVN
jgi:hypothetical protein